MNVTHVVLSLDCGGLERVVLQLLGQAARLGQRASVLCLERPGDLAGEAERMGVEVVCVGKRPGIRLSTVGRVRRVLDGRLRPDVMHTHQIGALFYAGPAARRAGVGVVVHTEHGKHYEEGRGRRRARWLGWLAARHARRFFCVSEDIASSVASAGVAPAGKVSVVPNGIETSRFNGSGREEVRRELGIPAQATVIGTVGRLAEVKSQDVLIRGFARLEGSGVDAPHLLLVGDGPLRGELSRLAGELGVAGRVRFAGYQAWPERFLAAMDVFALTSRSEGMPLVVLEAWAAGMPVVGSRVGGLPELIEEGRTGLLFGAGDEQELATCLNCLLADREWAGRMGDCGRELVRREFDVSVMAGAYHKQYAELLRSDAGVPSPDHALVNC